MGAHVVAIDIDADRLANLASYGAALTLNSAAADAKALRKKVREFAQSHGVPTWRWKIFEASGHPAGQALAFGLLAHGALLSVVGYTAKTVELRLSNLMAFDATAHRQLGLPARTLPGGRRPGALGQDRIAPFIERRPLSSINEVFEQLHHASARGRIVLIPEAHA